MRTHNHNVRPHVKIFSLRGVRVTRLVLHPRARIHVRNSHPVNTRLLAGQALFHPVHKRGIKAARLVVCIARKRRQATPFTRALAQHAIFTALGRRPVQNRRIFCDERRPRPCRAFNVPPASCRRFGASAVAVLLM